MLLGALLDLGVPLSVAEGALEALAEAERESGRGCVAARPAAGGSVLRGLWMRPLGYILGS